MITRNGTTIVGTKPITGLRRTDDLAVGLFVYGTGIDVETTIASIDSTTQISLSKNATASGTNNFDFTPANVGVYHERNCAMIDAYNEIEERGEIVAIILRNESNVTRGRYNSITKRDQDTKYMVKAYPINYNPNERDLEKAGLRERVDVVIYTSMKYWRDNSVDFDNDMIANKMTIKMRGSDYEVKDKGLVSQFSDFFLYGTFGLSKR